MDYYEGVVIDYIRANRAVFVNPQYLIQIEEGDRPAKGLSWWCDILAVDFSEQTVFLCEVSYSNTLAALMSRLKEWSKSWPLVQQAIARDSSIPPRWQMRPWLFIPEHLIDRAVHGIKNIEEETGCNIRSKLTPLEMTTPWAYKTWDRRFEKSKPSSIPPDML